MGGEKGSEEGNNDGARIPRNTSCNRDGGSDSDGGGDGGGSRMTIPKQQENNNPRIYRLDLFIQSFVSSGTAIPCQRLGSRRADVHRPRLTGAPQTCLCRDAVSPWRSAGR